MTRKEAIRMLVRLKERLNFEVTDAQGKMDALNMAIEALENEPCGDCVSRQAILNLKQTFYDNAGYETEFVDIEDIKTLPSVQPETDVLDKIRAEVVRKKQKINFKRLGSYEKAQAEMRLSTLNELLQIIDKYKAESEG